MVEQLKVLVVAQGDRAPGSFKADLERAGYHALEAFGCREGLEVLNRELPDVALADLRGAGADGLELLHLLRLQRPDLPVVVVPGPEALQETMDGVLLGAWDYLMLPLRDPRELDAALRRAAERARLTLENRGSRTSLDALAHRITERKQASEAAVRFSEDLERRVQERTAQLESANEEITTLNDDLVRRSRELEKANRQLESFSYSISHDLRTPLRHVHALSRMLQEDYQDMLDDKGRQCLGFVEAGCQRMESLVKDLMNFSKLSLQPLVKTAVRTSDIVTEVLQELVGADPSSRIDLVLGALPPCQADIPMLRQVFTNLIGNALKYSRKRELARIEVGAFSDRGATVYFVRDNGTGFDMKFAGKLFGVFQRLQHEYEGTGVGLAIASNIVQRHGGEIWAEAAEDRGATFFFTLSAFTLPAERG